MPPRAPPQRISVEWNTTLLIDSAPPATTRSLLPLATCMHAWITACRPDPQRRSICIPGTVTGSPASSAITRPMAGASMLG